MVITRQMQAYFDAVAYWDRVLLLNVETGELLRQGTKRRQRGRQEQLLAQARDQLRAQMRKKRRSRFRGHVAVDLTIFAHGAGSVPSAPRSVKRYLDAMNGIVYADDRQVAHLAVHRFADDWPGMPASRAHGLDLPGMIRDQPPRVSIIVIPLAVFIQDWERVFWMGERAEGLGGHYRNDFERSWGRFADDRWTLEDDLRLEELVQERRRDKAGSGWLDRVPPELATVIREGRQRDITELLERLMLDQRPDSGDHPGGADLTFDREALARLGLPDPGPRPRWDLPGSFWLPLKGKQVSWEQAVSDTMSEHRAKWGVLPEAFGRALALDIGAFGIGPQGKDIDNLAHAVLVPFERLYCGEQRGTVVSYRAYRRPSQRPGVRVMVMTQERMGELGHLIGLARSAVIEEGLGDRD
jgi:Holliday junction resolvase RusA-like endonuclease